MKKALPALALLIALLAPTRPAAADGDPTLDVAVGDPARKGRLAPLVLDGITDTRTSELISPATLVKRLEGTSLLFLGEEHTSILSHEVQLRVLKELIHSGRKVLLGLEMFPVAEQRFLDDWGAGRYTEEAFVEQAHWYTNWGYNWNYYREIFLFARDHKVPIYAINVPQEAVAVVARKGFDGLTDEEAAKLPKKIDFASADHRKLFGSYFDEMDMIHGQLSEERKDSMFQAQCTWDAVMGHNAVDTLKKHGAPGAIMVVLVGRGHVAFDLGAARQAAIGYDGKIASVIPLPVFADKHERTKVRASYAGFIWGTAREGESPYPLLGITISGVKDKPGLTVVAIQRKSVAEACGLCVGDELSTFDGANIPDRETLAQHMSNKRWGDEVRLAVKRGGAEKTIVCDFRRTPDEPAKTP